MKMKIDNIEYVWVKNDTFEKDGRTYNFASLKKITTYKGNKKFQNVTVKPEHVGKFKEFLQGIVEGIEEEEVSF